MDDKLRPKYRVQKADASGQLTGPPMRSTDPEDINSPFVLMPRKDPAALIALIRYCRYCEPGLANEIRVWLTKIVEAEPRFGTQGLKNFIYSRTQIVKLGVDV